MPVDTLVLRHRAAPLNAIDAVTVSDDGSVDAVKKIRSDDPYLEGHYPHFTIYPGIFIIESIQQAVERSLGDQDGRLVTIELVRVSQVRFTSPVLPGDELRLACRVENAQGGRVDVTAVATDRRDQAVARARLTFSRSESTDV